MPDRIGACHLFSENFMIEVSDLKRDIDTLSNRLGQTQDYL